MHIIKTFLLAAALSIAATSASAATYDIGELTSTPYTKTAQVSGAFTDSFEFSISKATTGSFNAVDIELILAGFNIFNIDDFTVSLYDSSNHLLSGLLDVALSVDSYTSVISGVTTGLQGGLYTFTAVTSPVPEPAMMSLMLSGAGLIGFMSYRRRKMA